jgi:pyridoxine 5-phosphate synthase
MTALSVNINKVALIRNGRGGNIPDLVRFAEDCERFGAQGITVHPRPDQRHVRFDDLPLLKNVVTTEFNIEGYPSSDFLALIEKIRPHQCTLVPDPPGVLTSNAGWDTITHKSFLTDVVLQLKSWGIRTSLFTEADSKYCQHAADTKTDRIEFYTGPYAHLFDKNPELAVAPYVEAAKTCLENGLEINAGHDLNLRNLSFFISSIPQTKEVSIGHALISDALYYGISNTIQMYLNKISEGQKNGEKSE